MTFDPPREALEFLASGGVVTLSEWATLDAADRHALHAAHQTLSETRAVQIALALQGRLTEGQIREREGAELEAAVAALRK